MYFRRKTSAGRAYLQIVESRRDGTAWLGEELPEKDQDGRTPFAPRCLKDVVEERLFVHRRDLLTRLDLVSIARRPRSGAGSGVKDAHAWPVLFLPRRVPGTGRDR
jgi:hypothetical protein